MKINIADVVEATRGRDAGRIFFVIGLADGYAEIANGTTRRVENPKKKKLKHLKPTAYDGGKTAEKLMAGEKVTNRELKRALSGIKEASQEATGGM